MIVQIKDLYFRYPSGFQLSDINIKYDGGVALLIGPNGAGKTTLIKLLSGFLNRISGDCLLLNRDCRDFYVEGSTEAVFMYENLPESVGGKVFEIYSEICDFRECNRDRFLEYLRILGLDKGILYRKFKNLSAGQKKKVYLSMVFSIKARVYIIDEIYAHVDAPSRIQIAELLRNLKNEGNNLILTSHIFDYLESIIDRAVMIYDGKIVFDVNMDELVGSFSGKKVTVRTDPQYRDKALNLLKNEGYHAEAISLDALIVDTSDIGELSRILKEANIPIFSMEFVSLRSMLEQFITKVVRHED